MTVLLTTSHHPDTDDAAQQAPAIMIPFHANASPDEILQLILNISTDRSKEIVEDGMLMNH